MCFGERNALALKDAIYDDMSSLAGTAREVDNSAEPDNIDIGG